MTPDMAAMTPNQQMEQFSLAYIRAVAAQAGCQVTRPEPDTDSVDGVLMSGFGRRPRIEFQAKATSRDILRDGSLHFPLPLKNYDDLRDDVLVPRILVVVLMPREEREWARQSEDELCLRRCGYWLSLEGRPAVPNTSSVSIAIPTANVFARAQLCDLMANANAGVPLC